MKKAELVEMILDLNFAVNSIQAYLENREMYSGKSFNNKLSDREKILKVLEYIKSNTYKSKLSIELDLYDKFTLDRINSQLYSITEIRNKKHLTKRTAPLNTMKALKNLTKN